MLIKISISSEILMVVLNGFLLMSLLNGRKLLLCYKLDVLCQNAYRKCFKYSREAEKSGLTLYSLVMDSGGGCGLLVLYVWCTDGEGGRQLRLSSSAQATCRPLVLLTRSIQGVVGDRAKLQAAVSVPEIFVSKS